MIPLDTWLAVRASRACAGRDAGTQPAVPRLAHAGAGTRGGLRLARRHVDRLRCCTRWPRRSACRRCSPRCRSRTTSCAGPGALYLAWLAWSTWRSRDAAGRRAAHAPHVAPRELFRHGPPDAHPQSEGRAVPARAVSAVRRSGARQRARAEPGARARRRSSSSSRATRSSCSPRPACAAGSRRVRAGPLVEARCWPACSPRSRRGSRWTIAR